LTLRFPGAYTLPMLIEFIEWLEFVIQFCFLPATVGLFLIWVFIGDYLGWELEFHDD